MSARRRAGWLFSSVFVALCLGPGCASREPADLVLYGGQVLTADEAFTIHSALAIKDGRILAVGGDEVADGFDAPLRIDLKGRTLLPGFMDTHIHIRTQSRRDVDLINVKSIADVQNLVRQKASELGPGEWVTGYGWDEALFAERRNLVRADLDAAAPDNPVVLTRAGGHSSVGNSRALEIAGITRATPDPENGLIERDQMPSDDGGVALSGAHRPKRPLSTRARCAASILASCSRKSQ